MAIVGRCPLDKRVGCEAVPMDWLVGWKGGNCVKDLNVPDWIPVAWRARCRDRASECVGV